LATRLTIPTRAAAQAPGPVRLTLYRGTAVSLQVMTVMTIGKLAAGGGVGVETVRFYQRRGLLTLPARGGSGFREYTEDDARRLAFIRRARRLGFTLGEIGDLLGSAEGRSADGVVRAAEAKLTAIGEQIQELTLLQCRLRRLVTVCEHGDSNDCVALRLGEHTRTPGPVVPEPSGKERHRGHSQDRDR
jgi:DNA-binding transcriptional MerR regulator